MLSFRWLPSLKRKHGLSRRRPRPGTLRNSKLALEFLEERLVLASNQGFVQQAFLDLLHRPVDDPSLIRLAGALDAGTVSRTDVAGFIVTSPEARVVQTQDLYNRYLHRPADPVGLSAFSTFLITGGSQEQLAAVLLGSAEYYANHGGNSNMGFLDSLYEDALGRPIDPFGQQFFSAALTLGFSREAVAGFVLTSPEYQANQVQGFFQTYLHRPAETGAVQVFAGALAAGVRNEAIIAIIVGSQEYFEQAERDLQPPAVTLTSAVSSPTNATPIPLTVTFSESVTGFTPDDLTVTNGGISQFAGTGAVYTLALTPLGQGAVMVDLAAGAALDAAGNASMAAAQLSLIFDSIAPSAPTLSSAANRTLTGMAEAGSTIAVSLDGSQLGTTTANSSGVWNFDYSGATLTDGSHAFTAMATDAAGNTSAASSPLAVTVDTTAPQAPTISQFSNGTLTGTAEAGSTVRVSNGSNSLGMATTAPSEAWSLALTLADGTYNLTATATDAMGNISAVSGVFAFTLDREAPPIPSIVSFSPDSGTLGDSLTNATTLMLSGMAEANATVTVLDGTASLGTTTAGSNGAWSFSATNLSSGSHNFTVMATDAANNRSGASSAFAINVDIAAPDVPSITDFSDSEGVLTGTAEAASMIQVWEGDMLLGSTQADNSEQWSLSMALAPGNHTVMVTATDAAGNQSPASPGFPIVILDTVAPEAPSLEYLNGSLSGMAEPGSTVTVYKNGVEDATRLANETGAWSYRPPLEGTFVFTATATDAAGNISPESISVTATIDNTAPLAPTLDRDSDNGTLFGTAEPGSTVTVYRDGSTTVVTVTANLTGDWNATPTLDDGTYHLTATATDAAGNISPASNEFNFTIDKTAPLAPTLDRNSDNGMLFGTAEPGSIVRVHRNDGVDATPFVDGTGAFSFTPVFFGDGTYVFTATATDAAGNTSPSSDEVSVTIDTMPPEIPTLDYSNGQFLGTAEPGSTVKVTSGLLVVATATVDGNGAWSAPPMAQDGTYVVTATATDAKGNTSLPSSAKLVTIDRLPPPAPTLRSDTSNGFFLLSGEAEASSIVKVFNGDEKVAEVTAGPDGVWEAIPTLEDGTYALTATATDAQGNTSPMSSPADVTIDTHPPEAPSLTESNGTLLGTAEPGSTVHVFRNGGEVAELPINNMGVWTYLPTLVNGPNVFTAQAEDATGNFSPMSNEVTITVDNQAPQAPTGLDFFNRVLFGAAEPFSTVTVYREDDNSVVATATADDFGFWFAQPTVDDGFYLLTATATDTSNNISPESEPVLINIDTTAPPPPSLDDLDGTLVGLTEPFSTVLVFRNGEEVTALPTGDTGEWIYPPTLVEGTNVFTVKARDAAGNTSEASAAVELTNNTTAPLAPTLAFANGMLSGTAEPFSAVWIIIDGVAVPEPITVAQAGSWSLQLPLFPDQLVEAIAVEPTAGTRPASSKLIITTPGAAADAPTLAYSNGILSGTAEPGSTVKLFKNGALEEEFPIDSSGVWSYTPALSDGTYRFKATETDATQETTPASSEVIVTIDKTPPPAPTLNFDEENGNLSGTAEPGSLVRVFWNGTEMTSQLADANGNWGFTPTFPGDGTYVLTATATDPAGNTSPASIPKTVSIDVLPPTSSFLFPEDFVSYTAAEWQGSITGTAFDGGIGVQQVGVSIQASNGLYWDGSAFASMDEVFIPATGTTEWSLDFPVENLPSDIYVLHSQATDLLGHVEPPGLVIGIQIT